MTQEQEVRLGTVLQGIKALEGIVKDLVPDDFYRDLALGSLYNARLFTEYAFKCPSPQST